MCVCVHGTSQRCTWDGAKYYYKIVVKIMHSLLELSSLVAKAVCIILFIIYKFIGLLGY